jgi:putative ABC transport system permease protein
MPRTRLAERLYRVLLRCYPGEFRDEYEREMLQAFRERLNDDRRVGWSAVLGLWWQVVVDSIVRAPGEHLDVLRQDIRYAVRSLRRARLFALTAIATLALGVGANAAIFSVVHAVALRPLPYDEPDRLLRIWEDNQTLAITGFAVSLPNFVSWRERSKTMDLAAFQDGGVTLRGTGDPVRVPSLTATPGLFEVLGVRPRIGRVFLSSDAELDAPPVALITEGLWARQFGSDPSVVGRSVMVGATASTIVGVLPDESVPTDAECFLPLRINLAEEDRNDHTARVIARVRPGVTRVQAESELVEIARQLEREYPDSNKGWGVTVSTLYESIVPDETRRALFIVLGAVCCVLLIACANVANLMLARAAGRGREIAVRLAIGAGRRRLVRQVLTEGLLLTLAGGATGVLVAFWTVPVLRRWLPASLPRADDVGVNGTVLLFSMGLCITTGLLFAVLPALAGSRADVLDALKQDARGHSGGPQRTRQVLAAAQIALATMLLVGAGLFVQTLQRLERVNVGFDPSHVMSATMGLAGERYTAPGAAWGFYQRLVERLEASPGIDSAAITSSAPFSGGNTGQPIEAVGPSRLEGKSLQADWRMVSPSYFRTLRIPLVRGELFSGNRQADEFAIVLSDGMARRIWGDDDPLGRQITVPPVGTFRVIGIVGDVRNLELALDPNPTMYISTARWLWPAMTVVVRAAGQSAQAPALLRSAVRELDPQLAIYDVQTSQDQNTESAAQPRVSAWLVGLFALMATVLSAIGIYGVLAYLVSQRKQEIGIRMALGAGRPAVLRLFLARGLGLAFAGVGAGIVGAMLAARWIESVMFGVSARDPWTVAAAAALTTGIAVLASYVPARRATRIDPLSALRVD